MGTEPFRIVPDDAPSSTSSATPNQTDRLHQAGVQALVLGLTALSQRFIIALSRLFVLLTVASAFTLWWRVLPDPTILQLVGLGLYAVFILAACWMVRKN